MTFSFLRSFPTERMPFPGPLLSRKEWILALYLASKWEFLRVRARATAVLICSPVGPLKTLEKIRLGREVFIPSWVIDGFVELVQAATITNEEALIIDIGASYTAYKLFRIRELRIAEELPSAKAKVEEIFKEELDHLRSKEKVFKEKLAKIIMGRPQALPQRILVSST